MQYPNFPDSHRIEESLFPYTITTYFAMFITLELVVLLVSSLLILPIFWSSWSEIAFAYVCAALILAPLCLIFAGTHLGYLRKKSGRVVFDGENLLIYLENLPGNPPNHVVKLVECRWFWGNRTWATLPWIALQELTPLAWERFLLIELPPKSKILGVRSPIIIAVGHDSYTQRGWEDAFYRLGTKRQEEREMENAPLSNAFASCLGFGCIFISFVLFYWLSIGVEPVLTTMQVPPNIVVGIKWPLFLFGGFMGAIIFSVAIYSRQNQESPIFHRSLRDSVYGPFFGAGYLSFLLLLGNIDRVAFPWDGLTAAIATMFVLALISSIWIGKIVRKIETMNNEKREEE